VDTGFVKTRFINETTGIEMLKRTPVSKSQANQRAGRAGRECPGKCFRLYPENIFENLEVTTIPEIQRMNIGQVFLQLKTLKVQSFQSFPFLSTPSSMVIRQALETLLSLGALDKNQQLTPMGEKVAMLPLHPLYAYFLIKSEEFHCQQEALIAVSLLSADTIFLQPFKDEDKQKAYHAHRLFASKDGDLVTLIHVYQQWVKANKDKNWTNRNFLSYRALSLAENIQNQLATILKGKILHQNGTGRKEEGNSGFSSCFPEEKEKFLKCLCFCFSSNIAQSIQSMEINTNKPPAVSSSSAAIPSHLIVKNNKFAYSQQKKDAQNNPLKQALDAQNITAAPYRTIKGHQFVHIHPSSVLFSMIKSKKLPSFVLYSDLLITNKQYMRNISVVDGNWLAELFPERFKTVF
jgi:HrpA-like RNA helicase